MIDWDIKHTHLFKIFYLVQKGECSKKKPQERKFCTSTKSFHSCQFKHRIHLEKDLILNYSL